MTVARSMLDTDTVVALLRGRPAARHAFRRAVDAGEPIVLSAVTYFELQYGIAKSGRSGANEGRLTTLLSSGIAILPFGEAEARAAGEVRAELEAAGALIGPYDILIAGHARLAGVTLVTGNSREFQRVQGLRLANWLAT